MDEYCAEHSGNCARLDNIEKEQCNMKRRLDKIWYLMLTTLVGVIITLLSVLSSHLGTP
jgi:hypothetical protein